ncbi:MAG TPA: hypothetical protein VGL72_04795 [Bryobacteraceae bacterium]
MATPKQIEANRANAKKSTGPLTTEGKVKASLNAVSHGLTSGVHFLKDEDPKEFQALLADLNADHEPATHTEQILVEKMALNHWLSLRATRLQTLTLSLHEPWQEMPKDLGLLIRYQTAADRAFHKAHSELLKIQKERKKLEIGSVSQNPEEASAAEPADTEQSATDEPENPEIVRREDKRPQETGQLPEAA